MALMHGYGPLRTEIINNPSLATPGTVPTMPQSSTLGLVVRNMMTKSVPNGLAPEVVHDSQWNNSGHISVIDETEPQLEYDGQVIPLIDHKQDSRADSFSTESSSSSAGSVTAVSSGYSVNPRFQLEAFHEAGTGAPFKYLWSYYMESTARFCAIHDLETPFLSSIVPLAANNPALQSSLMFLSTVYRNKILGMKDENHEAIASELSVRSMRGLRDKLSLKLRPDEALVGIATCLGLTCCYIGENSSEHYNTHLYGGLVIATTVLIPDKRFTINDDVWFLFKWLTYCTILVNINLLPVPERLSHAKAHNLPAMEKLYGWWQQHAKEDPEYYLPVDSFYGFGTRLAPLILQFNILTGREALRRYPGYEDVLPVTSQEIDELESAMWMAQECSTMALHSAICLRQTDFDLLHCDASFHAAALLYVYTYLKFDEFSQKERIPHLVSLVIAEVKAISPVCRTAAALLFVMYIAGSHAVGKQREFIYNHLSGMRETCLSSVDSVLKALSLIWQVLSDHPGTPIRECHRKVYEAGINVCVY